METGENPVRARRREMHKAESVCPALRLFFYGFTAKSGQAIVKLRLYEKARNKHQVEILG